MAERARANDRAVERINELRAENDELSSTSVEGHVAELPDEQLRWMGLAAVQGPGVRVTLNDAPAQYNPAGVAGDLLVVHEHDIQVVMNSLWASGAEAMTVQGQRVVSTTAVKCVGNTVVLHGVAYAPPYVIEAIGDPQELANGLKQDRAVQIYRDYAETYQLGYAQQQIGNLSMPAYLGSLLQTARVVR